MAKPEQLLELAREHLEGGEVIHAWVSGSYEIKFMGKDSVRSGVMMATDRRLVFYAKKMGGYDFETFPYANISSFERAKNFNGHSFRFFASGNTVAMKYIRDGDALTKFGQIVTERAGRKPDAAAAPAGGEDVFAALEKLGRLRDAGVVTSEEFEAKKKELLDRI